MSPAGVVIKCRGLGDIHALEAILLRQGLS